jgi:hypothetical protein
MVTDELQFALRVVARQDSFLLETISDVVLGLADYALGEFGFNHLHLFPFALLLHK